MNFPRPSNYSGDSNHNHVEDDNTTEEDARSYPIGEVVDEVDENKNSMKNCCTLFIGDIARFCTENEVRNLFSEVGKVENIDLKKKNGIIIGYGFVHMKENIGAVRAIKQLNGRVLCGRPIKIGWGVHNYEGNNKFDESCSTMSKKEAIFNSRNSLFVRFIASKLGSTVTEVVLAEVFSGFGDLIDCAIKSSNFNNRTGLQSGFGFVHFSEDIKDVESVLQILQSRRQINTERVAYTFEPSNNFLRLVATLELDMRATGLPLPISPSPIPHTPVFAFKSPQYYCMHTNMVEGYFCNPMPQLQPQPQSAFLPQIVCYVLFYALG